MLHCFGIELGVSVRTECAHLSGALIRAIQVVPVITLGCDHRVLRPSITPHETGDEKSCDECSHDAQRNVNDTRGMLEASIGGCNHPLVDAGDMPAYI